MSKTFKKFFSLVLAGCMTVGMCVSASAARYETYSIGDYYVGGRVVFSPKSNTNSRLNMYARSMNDVGGNTNVTTWNYIATDGTQDWVITTYNSSAGTYVIKPYQKQAYSLNYYTDGSENCTLYSVSLNTVNDYVVKMVDEGQGKYGIVLPGRVKCLTAVNSENVYEGGVAKGKNVRWKDSMQTQGVSNYQAWTVTRLAA